MGRFLLLLCLFFLIFAPSLRGQQEGQRMCISTGITEWYTRADPQLAWELQELDKPQSHRIIQSGTENLNVINIPLAIHVIHQGEAIGSGRNLSMARIQSQIDVLNEDFNRIHADTANTPASFKGVAGNAHIRFCLATIDPGGFPTNGISRHQYVQTRFEDIENIIKPATSWDPYAYLNIWTAEIQDTNALGYALLPTPLVVGSHRDGVVIHYENVGRGPGAIGSGRTATHEVGHYLGLLHPWANPANMGGCNFDDGIHDTPLQNGPYIGCPSYPQMSCGSEDMYMNFMDFVLDSCMNVFTLGQVQLMRSVLSGSAIEKGYGNRSTLKNSGLAACNLPAPPCLSLELEDFSMGFELFEDFSSWTIENTNGDLFKPDSASWFLPNTWELRSTDTVDMEWGAHSGNKFMVYFWNAEDETIAANDWFFTPCMDMKAGNKYELSFWYAVGSDASTAFYPEKLLVTLNQGPSSAFPVQLIHDLGTLSNPFPNYLQWVDTFEVISNGSYHIGFYCYSDPNQYALQIDDIKVRSLANTAIAERPQTIFEWRPGPYGDQLWVDYQCPGSTICEFSLTNSEGRMVWKGSSDRDIEPVLSIDIQPYPPGLYILSILSEEGVFSQKILLSK